MPGAGTSRLAVGFFRHGGRSMGSIRPLVTITILVVVGAYLYVKINAGPMQTHAGASTGMNQSPDGVPPLTATRGASLATETGAAAWPPATLPVTQPPLTGMAPAAGSSNPVGPPSTSSLPTITSAAKDSLPSVPPIPALPPLPATADVTPPLAQPSAVLPKDLPVNIPTARYPDEPGQNASAATAKEAVDMGLPSTAPISAVPAPATPPITSTAIGGAQIPPLSSVPPPLASPGVAAPATATTQTSAQNQLRQSPGPEPATAQAPDRYAAAPPAPAPPAAASPGNSGRGTGRIFVRSQLAHCSGRTRSW